jgi:hypothetical protein
MLRFRCIRAVSVGVRYSLKVREVDELYCFEYVPSDEADRVGSPATWDVEHGQANFVLVANKGDPEPSLDLACPNTLNSTSVSAVYIAPPSHPSSFALLYTQHAASTESNDGRNTPSTLSDSAILR